MLRRFTMSKQQIEVSRVSNAGSLELTEEILRMRAYQLFEQRGHEHGHDVDDWLQAEAEITGKKPSTSVDQSPTLHRMAAA
jgi:hypothetical protein